MAQETQTGVCINLEGCDGEGDGREVQKGGEICMADSCWRLTENNEIQQLSFNKKNKFNKSPWYK